MLFNQESSKKSKKNRRSPFLTLFNVTPEFDKYLFIDLFDILLYRHRHTWCTRCRSWNIQQ